MRLLNLLKYDIKAQFKNGIYFLYAVFTLLYIFLLYIIPLNSRSLVSSILIYTDPSTLGLFFMGAIILLEKNQKILNSLAVSPVSINEYIISKLISFGIISTIVALLIAISVNHKYILIVLICTLLSSITFTLLGLIIGSKINSLNQYMLCSLPIEIICLLPPVIVLFTPIKLFNLLPLSNIIIMMHEGTLFSSLNIMLLLIFILLLYYTSYQSISKMWYSLGGTSL